MRTADTKELQPELIGEPLRELKLLPDDTMSFVANGRNYIVQPSFSMERFTRWEGMGIEFSLTGGLKTLFTYALQTQQHLQAIRFADAVLSNDKILNGLAKLDEKLSYALQVCTTFVNRDDEDLRYWNPGLAAAKIQDWNTEGLDSRFFLRLAVNSVPGFLPAYKSFTQTFLAEQTPQTEPDRPLNPTE